MKKTRRCGVPAPRGVPATNGIGVVALPGREGAIEDARAGDHRAVDLHRRALPAIERQGSLVVGLSR